MRTAAEDSQPNRATQQVQAFLTLVFGQEADLAGKAALRTLLSDAVDRAAKMWQEVVIIVEEDRADVDNTLVFAERLQPVLPVMLAREADPYAALQADLHGSLLGRQELQQELHTMDGVTSALHALIEMHCSCVVFAGRMEACELSLAADSLLGMRALRASLLGHLGRQARAQGNLQGNLQEITSPPPPLALPALLATPARALRASHARATV